MRRSVFFSVFFFFQMVIPGYFALAQETPVGLKTVLKEPVFDLGEVKEGKDYPISRYKGLPG